MGAQRTFHIGPGVLCDIDRLVNTRLIVQANSGAGKSWALRRLLEQTHGAIQQLVIDPEGEFASLREKFDYVLAARSGGDTLADPRTAKLLAERVLELGVSAIFDIYELKSDERVRFVRLFLDALVDAPKRLWHPVLVLLDEAHVYAPEEGRAESADAVKSIATRGRKRGFCLISATQRLSKLHKDVAAESNNKLIGRSSLDVDMKRAADELGFDKAARLALRDLDDGEFFAFGPALTRVVTRVKVGPVQTTHPKAGSKLAAVVPPPTEKVRALLPQLSDLPAEAEAREKTVTDLKHELAVTRRELAEARKEQPPAKVERVEVPAVSEAQIRRVESIMAKIDATVERHRDVAQLLAKALGTAAADLLGAMAVVKRGVERSQVVRVSAPDAVSFRRPPPEAVTRSANGAATGVAPVLRAGARRILAALAARHPLRWTESQVATLAGLTRRGGTFQAYVGDLRRAGFIEESGGEVAITAAGLAHVGERAEPTPRTVVEAVAMWKARLRRGEGELLDALVGAGSAGMTREELAAVCGKAWRGGTFNAYLGTLLRNGLARRGKDDAIYVSDTIMEMGA